MWKVKVYKKDAIELCKSLKDNSVDFFCYDPPYSASFKLIHSINLKTGHRKSNMRSMTPFILVSNIPFEDYLIKLLEIQYEKLKPTGNVAIMMTERNLYNLWDKIPSKYHYVITLQYLRSCGGPHFRVADTKTVKNTTWPVVVLSKKVHNYQNADDIKNYLINQITADGKPRKHIHNIWQVKESRQHKYFTAKPLPLGQALVSCFCPKRGLVVDPFCGSGWIGEACITTGRRAILSDIMDDAIDATRIRLLPYIHKS